MTAQREVPILSSLFGKRTLFLGWLGVLVLAFAWLHALYLYTAPHAGRAWFAAGIAMLVVACRGGEPGPRRLSHVESALLGAAALAGILFLPRPYDLGPALLGAAVLLSVLPIPGPLRNALLPGTWVAGIVLVLQAALLPGLFVLASRLHETPFLTSLVYGPLALVAPGTLRTGATLQMATTVDSTALTPSWEKLGLIPGALAALGWAVLLLVHRRGAARLGSLVAIGLLYSWVRLVALFLVVNRFRDPKVFWDLDALFAGFVPLAVILAAWWSLGRREAAPAPDSAARSSFRRLAAAGAFLLVAGFTFFWGYQDPGTRKPGRVLIDEGHSDWEWTTQPFDKEWYGGKSGYNYYCLADYWNRYYHVETHRERLTPALLSQWDVLVIKTPTSAYARDEVEAIVDFVRRGGGLFLVGDHTNVFGSSTYLNPIAERFGLYFRYDATYTLDGLALSLWHPPALLPHAAVRHMGDFLFATSCSLDSPLLSENVILGYGLRAMYLDYSETSYFPTKPDKMDYMYPLIQQAGGVRFGKGRVLGFTDSTTLSNFFMFIPGKPELALGSIEWLNRSNRHGLLLRLALLAGLTGLVLLIWDLARGPRVVHYNAVVAVGLLTFVAVAGWCRHDAGRAYATPRPQRALDEVVFDGEHGSFQLPTTSLLADHWGNMHTFYVWMQRLGLVPRLAPRLDEALDSPGRVLVEVNPAIDFRFSEIDAIVDFVRRGGTLLVMDTPLNTHSRANQLLGPFGMGFAAVSGDSVAVLRPPSPEGDWLQGPVPGDTLGIAVKAFGITGGKPLLRLPDGTPVTAWRDFGRGKVLAFGASQLFSTQVMGNTAVLPNPRMRAMYQAQYDLLERVAGIRVTERYAVRPEGAVAP